MSALLGFQMGFPRRAMAKYGVIPAPAQSFPVHKSYIFVKISLA
jgi:hypothetical protein